VFRELAVSYLDRSDLAHVQPADIGFDVLGTGESEGRAGGGEPRPNPASVVSKGLVRSKTDRLMLVRGTPPAPLATPEARPVTMAKGLTMAGATALKQDLVEQAEAELSALAWSEPDYSAKGAAAEKRAEARMKGYVGEACPECANFTLVRNGTCLKCETCGATTGCS
jgi:ribonucleoside-diphosphate reductase alpha chain